MDEVQIEITETTEEILIASAPIIEEINISILEGSETALAIEETVEQVFIQVEDIAEEITIEIFEGGVASGVATIPYKIWTMPSVVDPIEGIVAYTGFSKDLNALTSGAIWAVKRLYMDGTEAWAGKTLFDQILDDYLTLIYT